MRGFFAIGVWHPKTEVNVGTLWRHASTFGAAFVFTVGRRYKRQPSDTRRAIRHVPLVHFDNVLDLIEHLPHGCPLVGVEMTEGAQPLHLYAHPERAAYLLGAEDQGLTSNILGLCHDRVQIEIPKPESLNVATAGSIVMYDRHVHRNLLRTI